MSKLFNEESSDSEVDIKTNSEYAKNYDAWRQKEELHKLHMKYKNDTDSSSSSSDDDDEPEINPKFEQDFFRTLSYLKNKDPRIYDNSYDCFTTAESSVKVKKKTKEPSMTIKDYERKLLLEKGGQLSDDEEGNGDQESLAYNDEQKQLKEELKKALNNIDDCNDDTEEWGGIFKSRKKTAEEAGKEEDEYKLWLAGQKEHLQSTKDETELKPLKEFWTDSKLDKDEKFLRDYILNNRCLEAEDNDYIPTYDEVVHDSDEGLSEDEKALSKQEEFEHKYNFRYEEPDQDFIKRFPRTMEQTLRKKDDKRKVKRVERKERKIEEKKEKMEEIKQLKALKKQEIFEKIKKLQDVTGNDDIGFDLKDLDEDFDPNAHDQRMQELFNNEFYSVPEGDAKPEFPELDEELEIEKWDEWRGNSEVNEGGQGGVVENEPHCEDENFNMDCDYDPTAHSKELIHNSRKKKRQRRKSKFAKLVSEPKPIFNPSNKTYQEYLDEYYKLDCEDVIGDIPCRFKYRSVVPNDFGLSVDEILMAKDKELNRWNSLKKAVQYRPEHVEKYDIVAFRKKGQNEYLKRKFLPSLFVEEEVDDVRPSSSAIAINTVMEKEPECNEAVESQSQSIVSSESAEKKSKKKKRKLNTGDEAVINSESGETKIKSGRNETESANTEIISKTAKMELKSSAVKQEKRNNKLNKKKKKNKTAEKDVGISDARLLAFGINPKRYKNKLKYGAVQK